MLAIIITAFIGLPGAVLSTIQLAERIAKAHRGKKAVDLALPTFNQPHPVAYSLSTLLTFLCLPLVLWFSFNQHDSFKKLPDNLLTPIVGKLFVNETVDLDSKDFEHCRFTGVT